MALKPAIYQATLKKLLMRLGTWLCVGIKSDHCGPVCLILPKKLSNLFSWLQAIHLC